MVGDGFDTTIVLEEVLGETDSIFGDVEMVTEGVLWVIAVTAITTAAAAAHLDSSIVPPVV